MNGETQLPQEMIYQAVKDRGYFEGYDADALAGRQVFKATEELAELYAHIYPLRTTYGQLDDFNELRDVMEVAHKTARRIFDGQMQTGVWNRSEFAKELADVAVPLFVAAQALGIDLVAAAVEKATADVKRGVR